MLLSTILCPLSLKYKVPSSFNSYLVNDYNDHVTANLYDITEATYKMKVEIAQRHQVFESSLFRYKYSFQKTQWSNEMSETIIELIKYLRTHQEFLYQILINTNDFSQVNSLSVLVSDFLYDNIFTTKGIEDDYLFLLFIQKFIHFTERFI